LSRREKETRLLYMWTQW